MEYQCQMDSLSTSAETVMEPKSYVYLFVRDDLSVPQQIIQTAHAVETMVKESNLDSFETNNMVLFGVKDYDSLLEVHSKLYDVGLTHTMFFEPDVCEHTAIATIPLRGIERLIFKGFKLKRK